MYDNLSEWSIQSNDIDLDGICNNLDNCPETYNPNQEDNNNNNIGDDCDNVLLQESIKGKELIKIVDFFGKKLILSRAINYISMIMDM